ncbi:MAG: tRNA (guanosine(46)-N7)-methyltransferase TrmB [Coriobacteriia bacterium]|nr:tRNA (guanosine(46)-N7)-methyltransferase TrmB [Coriobacteriia bacterium]
MARARKPNNLDDQLKRWSAAIVEDPTSHKGRWKKDFFPEATEVRLDLGCGKGAFLAKSALANPDVLYVGLDISSVCIARCAQKAVEEQIPNMIVSRVDASDLLDVFEPGELALIHLNFNAPFPPKKMAARRLTHIDHLVRYRKLVGEDGVIELRTDNMPYWKWTLEELRIAGYHIDWQTEDLHEAVSRHLVPEPFVRSEYDEKLVEKGAVVYALKAHPGCTPARMEQTKRLGLVDYLPEDLDELTHIPYGMEDTITNMRNRKRNAANAQARRDWWEHNYGSKRPRKGKANK